MWFSLIGEVCDLSLSLWGGVEWLLCLFFVFSLQLSPLFLRLSLEPLVLTVGMGDRAELSCCVLCRCCDVLSRI